MEVVGGRLRKDKVIFDVVVMLLPSNIECRIFKHFKACLIGQKHFHLCGHL